MEASPALQSAYLSTSDFPVVVLTEQGVLSDFERTQITEQLEGLIDERERHALVVDLTLGCALPDSQRTYIAEALEMRKLSVAEKWAALAIVVGEPLQSKLSKAASWQQLCPVPTKVFGKLEAATSWAESQVNPGGSGRMSAPAGTRPSRAMPVMSGMPDRTSRGSGDIDINARPGERTSISEYLRPTQKDANQARDASKAKAKKNAKPEGIRGWLSNPRVIGAAVAVVASLVLWLLGPPGVGQLSSAEANKFIEAKNKFALRLTRPDKAGTTAEPLSSGGAIEPGDTVGFEIDVPTKAYVMILQSKEDGSAKGAGPWVGQANGWLVGAGSKMALPAVAAVGGSEGKEAFYLAACPQNFTASDCNSGASGLTCPEGCAVAEFVVNKQRSPQPAK